MDKNYHRNTKARRRKAIDSLDCNFAKQLCKKIRENDPQQPIPAQQFADRQNPNNTGDAEPGSHDSNLEEDNNDLNPDATAPDSNRYECDAQQNDNDAVLEPHGGEEEDNNQRATSPGLDQLDESFYATPEDEDQLDEDIPLGRKAHEKIYAGATITYLESMLMLMAFKLQFKLPWEAMKMLLILVNIHLPENNNFVKSVYHLRKFFTQGSNACQKHEICDNCKQDINREPTCKNDDTCRNSNNCTFLTYNIIEQISQLFQRDSFRDALLHRFAREKEYEDGIEDVYDGEVYRSQAEFLRHPYNVSLMYYSDGIALFKSSKSNIWPLYFIVNELPYHLRYLPHNIILAGLWYGGSKPHFNSFILPLWDTFQRLYHGIQVRVKSQAANLIKVRCMLLNGIGDAPAKALMLYMNNFNGKFGCPKCLLKGRSFVYGLRRRAWIYPYEKNVLLRNTKRSIQHGEKALRESRTVFGIKGVSIFSKLVPDKYIESMGIDIMHSLISGAGAKKHIELWFNRQYRNEPFSLYAQLDTVDRRFLKIKAPSSVTRPPRSLKSIAIWKASEFKNWFFHYSLAVLDGILPKKYYEQYFNLVYACALLCQEAVHLRHLLLAKDLLTKYVIFFQKEYGERHMSYNVHSLLHLADCVRELGPLWTNVCFPLEDLNGKVVSLVTGTLHPELQISDSFQILRKIPLLTCHLAENSKAKMFMHTLKEKSIKTLEQINDRMITIGKYTLVQTLTPMLSRALNEYEITDDLKMWSFYKLKTVNFLYVARGYPKSVNNISYCVMCENDEVFVIECFLKVAKCQCNLGNKCRCEAVFLAILRKCEILRNTALQTGLMYKQIRITNQVVAKDIDTIKFMLFMVCFDNKTYFSLPLNGLEVE